MIIFFVDQNYKNKNLSKILDIKKSHLCCRFNSNVCPWSANAAIWLFIICVGSLKCSHPDDLFDYEPFMTNFFENPGLVQFNHRITAYLLFFAVCLITISSFELDKTNLCSPNTSPSLIDSVLHSLFNLLTHDLAVPLGASFLLT